jgi:hypothetical protein
MISFYERSKTPSLPRCPGCKGRKKVVGMGFTLYPCKTCAGVGVIYGNSKTKDDGKQDDISHSKDAKRTSDVDSIAADSGERKRGVYRRKNSLGISNAYLSECGKSREGTEKVGCDKGEG